MVCAPLPRVRPLRRRLLPSLQPIYVEDLAALAIAEGKMAENRLVNAIGPETFTYRELVQSVGRAVGVRPRLLPLPPSLGFACGKIIGWCMRDRFITWPEVEGLMGGYLYVDTPATGTTALTTWMAAHAEDLGRRYASEMARRRNRLAPYFK